MKKKKILSKIYLFVLIFHGYNISSQPTEADKAFAQQLFKQAEQAKKPYSQSKAHMSLPYIQKKIIEKTTKLAKNKKIVDEALKKEEEYKNGYYVFYTAIPGFHLYQDITRKMYKAVIGQTGALTKQAFQFVRFDYQNPLYNQYKNIKEFLIDEITKKGIINDREGGIGMLIVSTNIALFGNAGFTGESTWYFFNELQPWAQQQEFKDLKRKILISALQSFKYPTKYVDELLALEKYLEDKKGFLGSDLLQIFVPKKQIDDIGYISWRMGIPFDKELIPQLFDRKKMTFGPGDEIAYEPDPQKGPEKGKQYLKPTILSFMDQYKNKNPKAVALANAFLEKVKQGQFKLSPFLTKYTNNPEYISSIN